MCKLIRERKYTPKPQKRKLLPGEFTVPERPKPHENEDESDSDDGDYLHPLLMAAKKPSVSSPVPIPVPVSSSKVNFRMFFNIFPDF
jgi:PAB1-binding protein PBP1